jgi:hypothetical protein
MGLKGSELVAVTHQQLGDVVLASVRGPLMLLQSHRALRRRSADDSAKTASHGAGSGTAAARAAQSPGVTSGPARAEAEVPRKEVEVSEVGDSITIEIRRLPRATAQSEVRREYVEVCQVHNVVQRRVPPIFTRAVRCSERGASAVAPGRSLSDVPSV